MQAGFDKSGSVAEIQCFILNLPFDITLTVTVSASYNVYWSYFTLDCSIVKGNCVIKEGDNYIPSKADIVTTGGSQQVSVNLVITQETGSTNSNAQ